MSEDGMDLLLGGAPSMKFPEIGTKVSGKVIGQQKRQAKDYATGELKFWDDGSPIYEVVFTLATDDRDPAIEDDDGTRRVFARGQMLKAIGDALRKARWSSSLVGGKLGIKYAGDGVSSKRGFSPPKQFVAMFEPPATADEFDAMGGSEPDYETF